MAKVFNVHVTSQGTFKSCRQRYYFTDREQLNLESRRPQQALMIGTAVHLGIEYYYNELHEWDDPGPDDPLPGRWEVELDKHIVEVLGGLPKDTLPEDRNRVQEGMDLAKGMVQHYADWSWNQDLEDDIEVIASELKFRVPFRHAGQRFSDVLGFPCRVYFEGKIDQILRYEGDLWIGEIKTSALSGEQDEPRLALEEQPGIYQYALQYMIGHYEEYQDILEPMGIQPGERVLGVVYHFLRKKLPSIPKKVKGGGFSVAKNVDTTIKIWIDTLMDAGEDPYATKYLSRTKQLEEKGNTFFHRATVHRSSEQLALLMDRVFWTTVDMIDPDTVLYASPDPFKCRICPVHGMCLAKEIGADWEEIAANQYRKAKRDD